MKFIKNIFKISTAAMFVLLLANSSCKQPSPAPTPTVQYGTMLFHLHTYIDTNEVDPAAGSTPYKTHDGRLISLTTARVYLSNIKVIKADGSTLAITDTVLLKYIQNETYTVANIPAGNYNSVTFDVGIDSPKNHTNPSMYHAPNPLAAQTPPMWFGNTGEGYIFLNVTGTIDTSSAKNGTKMCPFSYQIGSDALINTIALPKQPFTITANAPTEVHIVVDYGAMFNGIDAKKINKCATFDNPSNAALIAKNIQTMVRYEQ